MPIRFKKKKCNLGVCEDCVYRDEFVGEPICWVSGMTITEDAPNTCDLKAIGGCWTCMFRTSEVADCRGTKVCRCSKSDYDDMKFVKVVSKCKKYVYYKED